MNFSEAQKDMNLAYFGGSSGIFVSGVIWCIAGIVALYTTQQNSMYALFFGGMLIHPLSILLDKLLKRSGKHNPDNPLGKLALESTVILFVGLFLAFVVAQLKVEWFYPIMLLAIGVRYLVFNTLFGIKTYWLLGFALMIAGVLCIILNASFVLGAFIGGALEIVFSLVIFNLSKTENLKSNSA